MFSSHQQKNMKIGITFRHVPFAVNELARVIRATGRPYVEEAISIYLHEH